MPMMIFAMSSPPIPFVILKQSEESVAPGRGFLRCGLGMTVRGLSLCDDLYARRYGFGIRPAHAAADLRQRFRQMGLDHPMVGISDHALGIQTLLHALDLAL